MSRSGLEAISGTHGLSASAITNLGNVDDTGIDGWELAASRRALDNLRTLLHGRPMLDLLAEQIEEAERLHKQYLKASHGEFTAAHTILRVDGISLADFFGQGSGVTEDVKPGEFTPEARKTYTFDRFFQMHPEHYAFGDDYFGGVETMGGIPTRSEVRPAGDDVEVPSFVTDLIDDSYPIRNVGYGRLLDGTFHSWALQMYKDTETGIEANLRAFYPAACPPEYVDGHTRHFAVEFRNAAREAAAARDARADAAPR